MPRYRTIHQAFLLLSNQWLASPCSRIQQTMKTKYAQGRIDVNRVKNQRKQSFRQICSVLVKAPRAVASKTKTRRTLVSFFWASGPSAFSSATFYTAVKFSCASSSNGLALASKSARGTSGLCARASPWCPRAVVCVELSSLLARVSTTCRLGTWFSADVVLLFPAFSPTLQHNDESSPFQIEVNSPINAKMIS